MASASGARICLPQWYVVEGQLGCGAQGLVILAHDKRMAAGSPPVAIKCIPRWSLSRDRARKLAEREILNHRRLFHKHIVAFREVFLTQTHLCIVIDYVRGGNLLDLLLRQRGECIGEDLARWFFQMLITAVDYCHMRGVTNRDIKLDNLLVEDCGQHHLPLIMVCDFGLSKSKDSVTPMSNVGTRTYKAPEVILSGEKDYDPFKADIFSCGIVLYRMVFGVHMSPIGSPCDSADLSPEEYLTAMKSLIDIGDAAIQLPSRGAYMLSPGCLDLLRRMLALSPARRITMDEIWDHAWFQENLPEGSRRYNLHMCSPAVLERHFSWIQSEDYLKRLVSGSGQRGSGQRGMLNGLIERVCSLRRMR